MNERNPDFAVFDSAQNIVRQRHQPGLDLRSTVRYSLHADVIFSWCDSRGSAREGKGYTRNISQRGAFIMAHLCPSKGDRITLKISLPALTGEKRELQIDAVGRVLRVDLGLGQERQSGFAVSNESINLCAA